MPTDSTIVIDGFTYQVYVSPLKGYLYYYQYENNSSTTRYPVRIN